MYSRVFKDISKIPDTPEDAAVYLFERGLKVVPFSITQKDSGSHIKRPTLLWKDGSYGTIKKSGKPVTSKTIYDHVKRCQAFGIVVPRNICVVDLDKYPVGFNNLLSLADQAEETDDSYNFIETLTVLTPKGGIHLYYFLPSGKTLTSASKLAQNIDIRGAENSCIIVPPSRIPGYDEPYQFENSLIERRIPSWIYAPLTKTVERPEWTKRKIDQNAKSWSRKYLANSCNEIASAVSGTRNDTLNKYAFACYKLIAKEGLISIEEVESELYSAGLASGLSQFEVHNTLQSARSGVHI